MTTRIDLAWAGGQRFDAQDDAGVRLTLDGERRSGVSPTEALLSSLGACMGIDVVMILEKMRTDLQELRISIEGDRPEDPPRYFRRLHIRFEVRGDVPRDKVERAVKLSFDKYCSVFHTLRKDLEVETSIATVPEA